MINSNPYLNFYNPYRNIISKCLKIHTILCFGYHEKDAGVVYFFVDDIFEKKVIHR